MSASRILITGVSGFVGPHLCRLVAEEMNARVVGIGMKADAPADLPLSDYFQIDIRDHLSVVQLVTDVKPTLVFHLAAQSSVGESWRDSESTLSVNGLGTLNLLDAVSGLSPQPRVIIPCSSVEYGSVEPKNLPVTEEHALKPMGSYAASKVFQDYAGLWYFLNRGLPVIRARAFNHTGPGQQRGFVCADFASQIATIERGLVESSLRVGNLQSRRDFTDVRDVVRAYLLLASEGEPSEVYNICSGIAYSAEELLNKLMGFSSANINIIEDADRARPSDTPIVVGDYSKLKLATGWEPRIPIEQTLLDLLNSWRERCESSATSP